MSERIVMTVILLYDDDWISTHLSSFKKITSYTTYKGNEVSKGIDFAQVYGVLK